MTRTLIFVVLAAAAGVAQAQIKCWTDANGKRACGDAPPPGAKVTTLKGAPAPETPPATASKDAKKDAKKGPLTPAEQEQEYRKRQAEAQKTAAKSEEEQKAAQAKVENCNRARAALRTLETGERVAITDAKGERYFLNEAEIAKATATARQQVSDSCN
jgi:Domain of unknown function (DUF4124)